LIIYKEKAIEYNEGTLKRGRPAGLSGGPLFVLLNPLERVSVRGREPVQTLAIFHGSFFVPEGAAWI